MALSVNVTSAAVVTSVVLLRFGLPHEALNQDKKAAQALLVHTAGQVFAVQGIALLECSNKAQEEPGGKAWENNGDPPLTHWRGSANMQG